MFSSKLVLQHSSGIQRVWQESAGCHVVYCNVIRQLWISNWQSDLRKLSDYKERSSVSLNFNQQIQQQLCLLIFHSHTNTILIDF